MTDQQAERIADLLERILSLMERAVDERDEPPARPARVILERGKPVGRVA